MPKIKKQTAAKIGLFSAIMVIFGSVVGIGIFFKNYSVFRNNGGNPTGILLSWIITIIMVACMALSFCEICTCKMKNRADGFGGWAERFCGHKFGRYAKLSYSLVFYAVDMFAIMFYAGEACMNCFADFGAGSAGAFDFGNLTTLYVFITGGALFALFIILNIIASKGMTKFSNITGLIKFVPIIAVIILGIVFGVMGDKGLWAGQWHNNVNDLSQGNPTGNLSIMGIIASLPAILFAYEGYLVVGSISGEMDNPEKNVPLAVIFAMIIMSALYILITIGCMTAGTGNVYHLMQVVFKGELANIFTTIMSVFIFICIIGVINSMTLGGIRTFQAICEQGMLFKGKQLVNKKPGNKLFAGGVWLSIVIGLWWVGTAIPSIILNTDQIVDGASVVMIVNVYILYGMVILCGLVNRKTKKIEVKKMKAFPVTAVVGVLACVFMICFVSFYQFLAQPLIEAGEKGWDAEYAGCGWGLFVSVRSAFVWRPTNPETGVILGFNYWQSLLCYWVLFAFMIACPFINDLLIKKFDKANKQLLIWQKAPKNYNVIG